MNAKVINTYSLLCFSVALLFGSAAWAAELVETCEEIDIAAEICPGAKPFPGPVELGIRFEPAVTGRVVLTLSYDSTGMNHAGKMTNFVAEAARPGEALFKTHLPYAKSYAFFRLEREGEKTELKATRGRARLRQTEAEAMRLDVKTGNRLSLVRDGTSEKASLVLSNPARRPIQWRADITLSDVFDHRLSIPFDRTVEAGASVEIPVRDLPAKGVWYVRAVVTGADGSIATNETRFARIDFHGRTPYVPKPKFRFGIHYHGTKYWPSQIDDTIDALVAAGAKFTRTDYDFMFYDVMPTPWRQNWAKADVMMKKLNEAGFAKDIIIYNAAPWAIDPQIMEERKGLNRGSCTPTKPGLFQNFARDIARRYGTDIDYYEIGNEWDLAAAKRLHIDEALRLQKEGMDGVHEGCPAACVVPNGWAYPSSQECYMTGRNNPGMYEAFCDHPELYDAWVTHDHSPFPRFVKRTQTQFLPVRASTGMKTRPWVCNETGLTCFRNGEREVARSVWAKPLYAWSWGATDYIWYNLKATGWGEGGEPGFGLMTADLKPRAGYAAFAALTRIFQGLDPDGRIHSRGGFHLLRFRGVSEGCRGRVIAGWDWGAEKPRVIRIRTDAARAEMSDFMGNLTPAPIVNGVVAFEIGSDPRALLLHAATVAEPADASELGGNAAPPYLVPAAPEGRAPDFVLDQARHVYDFHIGNPVTAHRLWMGPADHSAAIWLSREGDDLIVRVDNTDNVDTAGDGLQIVLGLPGRNPVTIGCAQEKGVVYSKTREGNVSRLTARLSGAAFGFDAATLKKGVGLNIMISEDDGEGPDGFLRLVDETEELKEVVFE